MTDAVTLARDIRDRHTTALETVGTALDTINARDEEINAFTVVLRDEALASAREVDRRLAAGDEVGPLAGVPVSIKDHIWLANTLSSNGSRALADFRPEHTAVCVQRLLDAGAVVVGKTNNPEFCYRGVTRNELFGITRNPHDLTRTTGGSSGGAAASVATGMVPLALGTDGGGSIRIPASFCGVAGLKPTHGLVPTQPGFRGWPSVSVHGPIAASVRDLALALSVMAGATPHDSAAILAPDADYAAAATHSSWDGVRVAASADLGLTALDEEVRAVFDATISRIRAAGITVHKDHPQPRDVCAIWDAVALPEGHASEGPLLAAHPDRVGNDAAAIIRAGAGASAQDYLDAQHARATFSTEWLNFFTGYDVLLTPTLPVAAFEADRLAPRTIDGQEVPDGFDAWASLLLPANLAGLPAASVPVGRSPAGLPIGLQVIGTRGADATVLMVSAAIEALIAG